MKTQYLDICKHCGNSIKINYSGLWVDSSPVFPQYCLSEKDSDQLHEPKKLATNEDNE